LLQFFNESYLLLSFSVAINVKALIADWNVLSSFGTAVNSLIAGIAAASLIIVPAALIRGLHKHWYPAMSEAIGYRTNAVGRVMDD